MSGLSLMEGKCGIKIKDYGEPWVMPMVAVKGQFHDSWLGLEFLVWDLYRKDKLIIRVRI